MARKRRDDDDIDIDEPVEEVDEPADVDAIEEPAEDIDEPPPNEDSIDVDMPPRARTPMLAIVLLILNLLTAVPFVVLLCMDYAARYQWTYATFVNRVYVWGLPLADEEDAASASFATRPRLRIDGDRIKEVYSKQHPKPPGTPAVPEPFLPVDTLDVPIAFHIRPSQIDDQVKRDLFTANGLSDPVATLDEEVNRLKSLVPQKLDEAADKLVADQGNDEKKMRDTAARVLLPLAWSPRQVDALQKRITEAQGPALEALLKDAAVRRMLADVLAPLNVYRPGDLKQFNVEKIADLDAYPLDALKALLQKRFEQAISPQHIADVHIGEKYSGQARDDIEKRHAIAFLLVDLARLKAPGAKEELLTKQLERAQVVSGLHEFAQAATNYARTLRVLENRIQYAIETDREGYVVRAKDLLTRTDSGFVAQHAAEIKELKRAVAEIEFTKKRLADLESQRKRYAQQVMDREELLNAETKKLVSARGQTAKQLESLHVLEDELHAAQVELSDAAARNARLEALIDQVEAELTGRKKR